MPVGGAQYDLLVVGGGINGLGIAADAAQRGLAVLLVEKGDFGGGTTSTSSRLIHGGLRYLQYGEMALVRESLRERGLLARQRPHLIRPIQLMIPSYRGVAPPAWKLEIGLRLYNTLASDPLFPNSRSLTTAEIREREPGLSRDGLTAGHVYPDAQLSFPERLCIDLMRETVAAGGEALNHTRVVQLITRDGRVEGARLRDELNGAESEVTARVTVNAAGPWVDQVNQTVGSTAPDLIGGTWGSHVVLPLRPEGPHHHLYASAKRDGRPFFILPWDDRLLVGTTDVPFQGDPDELRIQDWEVEYLLTETNRLFPGAKYQPSDVQHTTIGVRPLPSSSQAAGAITRRHFLVDHERQGGPGGLGSIVGGKLTTYRSLAEEVVDWVVRRLGGSPSRMPTRTREVQPVPWPRQLITEAVAGLRALGVEEGQAARLVELYGLAFHTVLRLAQDFTRPEANPATRLLEAQVLYALGEERARTVEDILYRRLMLLPPTPEQEQAVRNALAQVAATPKGPVL